MTYPQEILEGFKSGKSIFVSKNKKELLLELLEEKTEHPRACFDIREFESCGENGFLITWLSYNKLKDWQIDLLKVHSIKQKIKPLRLKQISIRNKIYELEEDAKRYQK